MLRIDFYISDWLAFLHLGIISKERITIQISISFPPLLYMGVSDISFGLIAVSELSDLHSGSTHRGKHASPVLNQIKTAAREY